MKRGLVVDCPAKRGFAFQCPLTWEALTPTDDESVRYCGACEQPAYACGSEADEARYRERGACIARAHHKPIAIGRLR